MEQSVDQSPSRARHEALVERRRGEIVAAAYEVFVERGYTAAGIADIAGKLGIGHGTVYRYFENKREILDHVVDYAAERIMSAVYEAEPPRETETFEEFVEQLASIASTVFSMIEREPGAARVVFLEATAIDEELMLRLLGFGDAFAALAASYLDHGVRAGFLRPDLDTDVAARGVLAMTAPGLARVFQGSFGAEERERYLKALVGLLCDGIRARPVDVTTDTAVTNEGTDRTC